jgi:hypothetical protein
MILVEDNSIPVKNPPWAHTVVPESLVSPFTNLVGPPMLRPEFIFRKANVDLEAFDGDAPMQQPRYQTRSEEEGSPPSTLSEPTPSEGSLYD